MSDQRPRVSLVLPCHRAGELARKTVAVMIDYLPTVVDSWEILVVDDGGNDFDALPLPQHPAVKLLSHSVNLGKGAAVRTGMLAASGEVRVFTDVDMPYDRELLPAMVHFILSRGFHLVIGDRTIEGSRYQPATGARRVVSAVASRLIGSLVTGGFHDTQCGIKAVRGDVAEALFPLVKTHRFAFDVEVVYLSLKHGLDIKRLPVRLRRNETTSVRPLRDSVRAAVDILAIKLRQLRGDYASPELRRIALADVEELMGDLLLD
jgi:dolichyl-phosphate beta-glucosyltransferase